MKEGDIITTRVMYVNSRITRISHYTHLFTGEDGSIFGWQTNAPLRYVAGGRTKEAEPGIYLQLTGTVAKTGVRGGITRTTLKDCKAKEAKDVLWKDHENVVVIGHKKKEYHKEREESVA